jgi:hypothetical protein
MNIQFFSKEKRRLKNSKRLSRKKSGVTSITTFWSGVKINHKIQPLKK